MKGAAGRRRAAATAAAVRPLVVAAAAAGLAAALTRSRLPAAGPGADPGLVVGVSVARVARVGALVLAGYVAAVAGLAAGGSIWSAPALRAASRALPGTLRAAVLGSSLLGVAVAAPLTTATPARAGAAVEEPSRPPPTMVAADGPTSGLAPVPPAEPAPAPVAPPGPSPTEAVPGTWTVRPGDHFWSIAHRLVAAELGRPPSEAEVRPRWLTLIELNRDRLVVPGNPDLLRPGQVLRLPGP